MCFIEMMPGEIAGCGVLYKSCVIEGSVFSQASDSSGKGLPRGELFKEDAHTDYSSTFRVRCRGDGAREERNDVEYRACRLLIGQ